MRILLALLPLVASSCTSIPSGRGPEDIVTAKVGGKPALVTATGTRTTWFGPALPIYPKRGCLETFRPGTDAKFVRTASLPDKGRFYPLGLSYIEKSTSNDSELNGLPLIYATNSLKGGFSRAEIYDTSTAKPRWIKSTPRLRTGVWRSFNSICATPDGTLFASIMKVYFVPLPDGPTFPGIEDRPMASDVIVSLAPGASQWKIILENVGGANGLALSPDGTELIVCAYYRDSVFAFRRNPEAPDTLLSSPGRTLVETPFHPDNISPAPGGRYLVAGQISASLLALEFILPIPFPTPSKWGSFRFSADSASTLVIGGKVSMRPVSVATELEGRTYLGNIIRKDVLVQPASDTQ